jgi:nicotinamide riboside transporter PnuC
MIQLMSWTICALSIVSVIFAVQKNRRCWSIGLVSALLSIEYSYLTHQPAMMVLNAAFVFFNAWGLYKWKGKQ